MIDPGELERGYRRWLRWYPRSFRRERESEILAVLMAGAREGQRRPELVECLDLARGGLVMRLRPRVHRSDRSLLDALRLMCLGAALELLAAITLLATAGDLRLAVARAKPGLTDDEWHAIMAGHVEPTALAACVAAGLCLWLAWSIGRGHRWGRLAFTALFGVNTYGLVDGLLTGSAEYARPDLAVATLLWLVQLATVTILLHVSSWRRAICFLRHPARRRSQAA